MASSYAAQGFQLLQSRPEDGIAMFEKGLRENPADPDCLLGLARVRVLEENPMAAKPLLQRLLEVDPLHSEALSHRALIQYAEGDKRALATLKSAASSLGAGPFELLNLARALNAEGDGAGAEAAYRRAIALEPANAFIRVEAGEEALRRNDARAAVEHLEAAASLAPYEYVVLLKLGQALQDAGAPAQAAVVLTQAQELAPLEPAVQEELFQAHFAAGAWQAALDVATRLSRRHANTARYSYLLGICYLKLNRLPEARRALEAVVAAAPRSPDARQALAQVLRGLNQPAEAKKVLEQALAVAPESVAVANDLALLYFDEKPEGMAKAEKVLRQALKAAPEEPTTHFNLALALSKRDPRAALAHAKRAKLGGQGALRAEADRLVQSLSAR